MLGRLAVGIALGLVAAACTPSSSPTTVAPSTSTVGTPATTTETRPVVAEPDELVVFPEPVGPGERIELCAGTTGSDASALVISTAGADATVSVRISQQGTAATCWAGTVPENLVRSDGGQPAEVPLTPGTYDVAVVTDGVVAAAGRLDVAEPAGQREPAPWISDPVLVGLPAPVALSNAHAAGGDVILHGGLHGVVDVALPSRIEAPLGGASVHLWVDADTEPAELPYDLVSVAGATWLTRDPRFPEGHRPLLDLASGSPEAPAMSLAEQMAWPLMGDEPIVYLRTESSEGTTGLWAYDPDSGYVWTLTIFPADGPATGEWESEPRHGGPLVGLSASDGVRAIRLGVDPILPPGDEGYPAELPSVEVDENDLRRVIEEMLALWETYPGGVEAALSPDEIHRTFLRDAIRNADTRLYGPFVVIDYTGEVPPGSDQQPVVAPGRGEARVTFGAAADMARRLDPEATVDLGGPQAVFVDDRGVWWFCLDTGFRLPADIAPDFARELAAEVCRLPLFARPLG